MSLKILVKSSMLTKTNYLCEENLNNDFRSLQDVLMNILTILMELTYHIK